MQIFQQLFIQKFMLEERSLFDLEGAIALTLQQAQSSEDSEWRSLLGLEGAIAAYF